MPSKSSCKKGYIKRKGYTRKVGDKTVKVPAKCIRATSQSGEKTSDIQKLEMKKLDKMHDKAREKFGTPKCAPGEIVREGYHRSSFKRSSYKRSDGTKIAAVDVKPTWVPPTCVPAKGNAAVTGRKGKKLFIMEKDDLSKYGYHDVANTPDVKRHNALKKALEDIKPLPLFRKLVALSTLTKNTNPELSNTFRADAEWVKTTGAYKRRKTATGGSRK